MTGAVRMLPSFVGVLFAMLGIGSPPAAAAPAEMLVSGDDLRFAMVVSSPHGKNATGTREPELPSVAEKTPTVRDALVDYAHFPSGNVQMLVSPTLADFRQAFSKVIADIIEKRKRLGLGAGNVLFFFIYTGHGRNGQLFLDDGPLAGGELQRLLAAVPADFKFGVFDACNAASVLPMGFKTEPVQPAELLESMLDAKGTLWFFSAKGDQLAWAEAGMGGVFTYYFTEALQRAQKAGGFVTIDQIWDYSFAATKERTKKRPSAQTPEVSPNYRGSQTVFAVAARRSATIRFALKGDYGVSYSGGRYSERFRIRRNDADSVPAFPGLVDVKQFQGERLVWTWESLNLRPGGTLEVGGRPREARNGTNDTLYRGKSETPQDAVPAGGDPVVVTTEVDAEPPLVTVSNPAATVHLGVDYGYSPGVPGVWKPEHKVGVDLRLWQGGFLFGARIGWGTSHATHGEWSYRLHAFTSEAQAGYGWDIGSVRLAFSGLLGIDFGKASYRDDDNDPTNDVDPRKGWILRPGAAAILVFPNQGLVSAELAVSGGACWGPPANPWEYEKVWNGWAEVGFRILFRSN